MKKHWQFIAVTIVLSTIAAGSARAEEKKIEVKGYLQEMYRSVSNSAVDSDFYSKYDSYYMRLARVVFSGKPNADWAYNFQIDALQQPALLDAYLDFSREKLLPEPFTFRLRAGQFPVPFSMESQIEDYNLDTINRSQGVNNLAPGRDTRTKGRDIGASLQVTASPWEINKFAEVTIGQFNGEGANNPDLNNHKGLALRGVINPAKFVSWGVSCYDGNLFSTTTTADRFGTDISLTYGTAYLKGEYIRGRDGSVKKEGWYVQSAIFVLPKVLQAVAKYDVYDPDLSKSGNKKAVSTAGANWYFTDGMRLQATYEWEYRENIGIFYNVFSTVLALNF